MQDRIVECEKIVQENFRIWLIWEQFCAVGFRCLRDDIMTTMFGAALYFHIHTEEKILCITNESDRIKAIFIISDVLKAPILIACKRMDDADE